MVLKCYNFPIRRLGPVDLGAHRDAVAKEEALLHLEVASPQQRYREGYSSLPAANRVWKPNRHLLTAQAIEGFVANAPNETKLRLGLWIGWFWRAWLPTGIAHRWIF